MSSSSNTSKDWLTKKDSNYSQFNLTQKPALSKEDQIRAEI
jgi:hypothetical protein